MFNNKKHRNMKRRFLLLLFVHVFVVLSAIAVTIDGVRYEIYNGSATVCGLSDDYNGNGNVVIPQYIEYKGKYEVKSIAERAFESSSITSVTIPNSVTYIGKWAFDHCYSLSRLILGNSLEGIGFCAFSYCRSLTSVTIPNSVKSIGGYAFEKCESLTSIIIPNSVTNLEGSTFYQCSSLTSVTLSNNLRSIGTYTFAYCEKLINISIPNSVTSIGNYAFFECKGLKNVSIGIGLTSIGKRAFDECISLSEFKVNSDNPYFCSVFGVLFNKDMTTLIGYPAGKSEKSYTIPNSVDTIGEHSFCNCVGLTTVIIPHNVTSIEGYAFSNLNNLTHIVIPNSVKRIGQGAFGGCRNLSSFIIENGVETIGLGSFQDCTSLTSVSIPNSVTKIGSYAFLECSGLTTVVIGSGAKDIYGFAFQNCDNVKDIFCYVESTPSSCGFDFNIRETATLHVPAKSIDLYKKAKYWKDFKNIVALTDNDPKPTGVINIKDEIKAEERYYDLHGYHVNKPSKGIYIINGKKVLIK